MIMLPRFESQKTTATATVTKIVSKFHKMCLYVVVIFFCLDYKLFIEWYEKMCRIPTAERDILYIYNIITFNSISAVSTRIASERWKLEPLQTVF